MGTLPLDKACIFICLALILTFTSAERQYFSKSQQLTWDEARSHCQVCYKDLVALTSDNVQVIIKMVDTDHWIGLRKHFPKNVTDKNNFTSDSNFTTNDNFTYDENNKSNVSKIDSTINIVNNTNNTTRPPCKTWCKWANGDPLIFQNWQPGMPVFKSRLPEIKCCSCSCTCPGSTTRVTTRLAPFTESPTVQTSVMYYPPESTGQVELTKASEGTTGETYHVPSTPSAASGKTEARTTQMRGTITTNQEEITTEEERKTTKPTNQNILLSCTMKEKTNQETLTTNHEGLSTSGEITTDAKHSRQTTAQDGPSTVGESTTAMKYLSATTTQEGITTARESATEVGDLSVTTTLEGISNARESVTKVGDLSLTTTPEGISTARESATEVGDLSVTTTQEGISTVGESTTAMKHLLATTNHEGISTAGVHTTDMEDHSETTNQGGFSTTGERMTDVRNAGESTTKVGDLSVTTTQEGISTAGDSTTHWKGCETTNLETFLTCKVVENPPDTGNCFKTTTPGEISTVSDSTTVAEKFFTTDQEQKSTFQTNISFTTDKITHSPITQDTSPITQDTTGNTTDQQTPVTSTKSTTTFDAFESSSGSLWTTTLPLLEATCEQSPVEIPLLAEINENYIEDSCVVITSDGPWIERRCSEILPFICYEDRFFGQVNVTNVTSESATLTWLPGPGNISHYDVEVTGDIELENVTGLTLDLFNLTAGAHYNVQVFPVKCGRRLNPQNASFYTKPFRINDLKVNNITEKSVFLSWKEPHGKADLYIVKTGNRSEKVATTNAEVKGLTPGFCYTFAVNTAVQDESEESEESSITACTRPAKVSNLKVTDITVSSLTVSWENPEGFFTGFNVTVYTTNETFYVSRPETNLTLTNLPSGTKIDISVGALSNHSLMGDITNITNYTAPLEVTDVILTPGNNLIKATWKHAGGSGVTFFIEVWHEVKIFETKTTAMEVTIENLKSSTNYTVFVHAVSGNISGPKGSNSSFTLPNPPSNVRITFTSRENLTLQWDAPDKITKATYKINVTSYWNSSYEEVKDTTTKVFTGLKSGTNYTFEVYTVAGDIRSSPAVCYAATDPDEREISLSMLCSSATMANCADLQKSLVIELTAFLQKEIGDQVIWKFFKPNN